MTATGSLDLDHDACYRAMAVRDAASTGGFSSASRRPESIAARSVPRGRRVRRMSSSSPPRRPRTKPDSVPACVAVPRPRPTSAPGAAPPTPCRGRWPGRTGGARRGIRRRAGPAGVGWASGSFAGCSSSISAPRPSRSRRSRRVLLAKQLVHETRLPMTEIAMAAGFGSLRRFNDTFQALFQAAAHGAAPRRRPGCVGWPERRDQPAAALPAALRLAGHAGFPARSRDHRGGKRGGRHLPADHWIGRAARHCVVRPVAPGATR